MAAENVYIPLPFRTEKIIVDTCCLQKWARCHPSCVLVMTLQIWVFDPDSPLGNHIYNKEPS